MKHLQNQNGNTLIENLIAIFLLALFAIIVSLLMLAAANQIKDTRLEDAYINQVSTAIEAADVGTVVPSSAAGAASEVVVKEEGAKLSFKVGSTTIEIDGTYIYDQEGRLGEFVADASSAP